MYPRHLKVRVRIEFNKNRLTGKGVGRIRKVCLYDGSFCSVRAGTGSVCMAGTGSVTNTFFTILVEGASVISYSNFFSSSGE
jgi:hypothetical protein